jgi:hypothetical protein
VNRSSSGLHHSGKHCIRGSLILLFATKLFDNFYLAAIVVSGSFEKLTSFFNQKQCCESRSAMILVGCIRIRIRNVDPDPE